MPPFLLAFTGTLAALLLGAGILHLLPRLGPPGRAMSRALCRAPWLDLPITYFTILPLILGSVFLGWQGAAGALLGQVGSVILWGWMHELANLQHVRGPRIVRTVNGIVGRWRNHAAAWTTATVTPLFWFVRIAEVFAYPVISLLVGLPRYKQSEWVTVSRQKFTGLVGHDLIWCLYCDWMTGVWSLGTEMLRNVESFWCPIRFYDKKKCDNCTIDFPDVANGWVNADGTMAQVTELIESKYGSGERSWFGHPTRLTVEGKSLEAQSRPGP